jgi:predicted alpha/beta-fold hydrolase
MTLASAFWPRKFPKLGASARREFEVEPGSRILAKCHWQVEPKLRPTLVLLHGLEGSSESGYMLGAADKAFRSGFNVLRVNQRNCGGTANLTPTLYNSGLSGDMRAVTNELIDVDGLPEVFAAGSSMGGNIMLKMAGEFGDAAPQQLKGVIGICPAIDLAACADDLAEFRNIIYSRHFVNSLKRSMKLKAAMYPGTYSLEGLNRVRTVRQFDDVITARYCGFRDAEDYYDRASALRVIAAIRVPTLIMTAQDDPFVPFKTFGNGSFPPNPNVTVIAPKHGGHCAFISRESGEERFWAEARLVEFCKSKSALL